MIPMNINFLKDSKVCPCGRQEPLLSAEVCAAIYDPLAQQKLNFAVGEINEV